MPPSIEFIAAQLKNLIPLLKSKEEQNVEIQLIKRELEALRDHKVSNNDLTKFELKLAKQHAANELENEKQFGKFRNKLVILAIAEKILVAAIIYYVTKG